MQVKSPAGALARREFLMAHFQPAGSTAEREDLKNGEEEERNSALIVVYYVSRTRLGRDRSRSTILASSRGNIVYPYVELSLMTFRAEAGKTTGGSRTGY